MEHPHHQTDQPEPETPWTIPTRYLILSIVILLLAALIYYARTIIGPLVIAALVAYVLNPAVTLVMRHTRLKRRQLAVPLVYVIFWLALAAIPAMLTPTIIAQISGISDDLVGLQGTLERFLEQRNLDALPLTPSGIPLDLPQLLTGVFNPAQLLGILETATTNFAWILLIVVVTYYFLLDWEKLVAWFFRLVPEPYQADAQRLFGDIQAVWQAYLRGQLLLMLIVGTSTWLLAAAIGLPDALLIGFLTGALDVVPNVGAVVAMVVGAGVAFFTGSTYLSISNFWFMLLVVAIFAFIQGVESVWIRPLIFGHSMRLHPAIVFVAIVGALALAGVVVALIIIPIISSLEILGNYIFRRILGQNPWDDAAVLDQALPGEQPE